MRFVGFSLVAGFITWKKLIDKYLHPQYEIAFENIKLIPGIKRNKWAEIYYAMPSKIFWCNVDEDLEVGQYLKALFLLKYCDKFMSFGA